MNKIGLILGTFIGIIALIIVVSLLLAYPVMWLWNECLVGTIAGVGAITSVWHAWGLMILTGLLFKSSSSKSSSK